MAFIYRAELSPSKLEMLTSWVPSQPWADSVDTSDLVVLGAYRFDDPDGEVGLEAHLLKTVDGQTLHVPVTYRCAPLAGADSSFVTTMQHSVLGERWVHDGCGDPVFVRALASAVLTGGFQADLDVQTDQGTEARELTTFVTGSGGDVAVPDDGGSASHRADGTTSVVTFGGVDITVVRVVGSTEAPAAAAVLTGTWPGQRDPALLAYVAQ